MTHHLTDWSEEPGSLFFHIKKKLIFSAHFLLLVILLSKTDKKVFSLGNTWTCAYVFFRSWVAGWYMHHHQQCNYDPRKSRFSGGYIDFILSVRRLSVCPSIHPSNPPPVSALQRLQFWLDPFHIYTSYQTTSEGVSHVIFYATF